MKNNKVTEKEHQNFKELLNAWYFNFEIDYFSFIQEFMTEDGTAIDTDDDEGTNKLKLFQIVFEFAFRKGFGEGGRYMSFDYGAWRDKENYFSERVKEIRSQ